jgi:hypothetical protein
MLIFTTYQSTFLLPFLRAKRDNIKKKCLNGVYWFFIFNSQYIGWINVICGLPYAVLDFLILTILFLEKKSLDFVCPHYKVK